MENVKHCRRCKRVIPATVTSVNCEACKVRMCEIEKERRERIRKGTHVPQPRSKS